MGSFFLVVVVVGGQFKKKHFRTLFHNFLLMVPTLSNIVNLCAELPRGPVGQIVCLEKEVMVLEKNHLLLSPPMGCFSWGFPDNSCAFGNSVTEKVCICTLMALLLNP